MKELNSSGMLGNLRAPGEFILMKNGVQNNIKFLPQVKDLLHKVKKEFFRVFRGLRPFVVNLHPPHFNGVIPYHPLDLGIELDVAVEVIFLGHISQVFPNLLLWGVIVGPI